MTIRRLLMRTCVVAWAALACSAAVAQWAWKDENGRVVYSDRPPPASVTPDRIVRQPGGAPPARSTDAAPAVEGKGDAKSAPKTWAEREAEYRKRTAERADADKKASEKQAETAQRRADCERARSYAATLESGVRIARTNAQGEREFMEDAQRASELARAREIIAQTCN